MITEELRKVITDAGLVPNHTDTTQLSAAVLTLIASNTDVIPVGTIIYVPASAPPTGFLKLNGSLLLRSSYAAMWAFAQASGNLTDEATWAASQWGSFSTGDLSTTFRIPDARGEFTRAFDDGRGVDSGRVIGSWIADDFKAHNHSEYYDHSMTAGLLASVLTGSTVTGNDAGFILNAGGAETRPRSIAELACIKY